MRTLASLTATLAAACLLAAPAATAAPTQTPDDAKVLRLDLDEMGLGDLEDRQQAADEGQRKLTELGRKQRQARRQLPVLARQAREAKLLAARAKVGFQSSQRRLADLNEQVNASTETYMDLVGAGAMSDANQHTGQLAELAEVAAQNAQVRDAALVYSQGQVLINQANEEMDGLREAAGRAATAKARALAARTSSQEADSAAADALASHRQLLQALRTSERDTRRKLDSDQRELAAMLDQVLGNAESGELPDIDIDVSGLPVGQRMAVLALREFRRDVTEVPMGSNNGTDISRYRTATRGAFSGAPWCAYFTSYIARRAGRPIGPGGSGMGYVPDIITWARGQHRFFAPGGSVSPRPGDIILWPQHVGIVVAVKGQQLITVEGNSSDRVARNVRPVSGASGFLRLEGRRLQGRTDEAGAGVTPDNSL